ncbi:hypothetical protein [Spiroplasma endosymbiont of Cantharis nigra]|uniref:hypothetical protein n=1 Tax=Spiroplasma endosymbiont of Cantharis nigra TaxID=3066278 RepID=UPI0030D54E08
MTKKILLISTICLQFILMIFSLAIFINKSSLERSVYLDFKLTNEMKENFKGKEKLHAFSTDAYENYALYIPSEESNSMENAEFYGDIEKYNYLNNEHSIDIWENDFNTAQIVVVVNEKFDSIEVELEELINEQDFEVEFGFNEFIYASDYKLTNGMKNPFGIQQTLLVPEKINNRKVLNNVYENKVYIINVSVKSNEIKNETVEKLNFKITGKNENEKDFSINNQITLNLFDINYDDYKEADYNIFYFPEWTSAYYNSVFKENENRGVPIGIEDKLSFDEYLDFNWNKYWKNEYESLAELGMDSFQLRIDDSWNNNWDDEREFHNLWKVRRKSLNFTPWRYKGDFNTINSKEEFINIEDIQDDLYIDESDWNTFDTYLNLLSDAGMKHGFVNSTKSGWTTDNKTLNIYNEKTEEYFYVNGSLNYSVGQGFMNWWFKEFKKHVDNKKPKWANEIKLYYYLDEINSGEVIKTNEWLKTVDPNKDYLGMAFSDWERDIDYKNIESYDHIDYAWTHLLDIYNEKNKNYNNFKKFRNKNNLKSGEYFLDSDSTFSLTRSEPGILGYIQSSLYKQGEPHYMKYILNGWEEGHSAWSSDFNDYSFIDISYVSGDTLFTYPQYDTQKDKQKIIEIADINSDENFKFMPSTRLLQLAVGTNNVNKINYLIDKNYFSEEFLYKNIAQTLKLGKKLSGTKFDLNYNKTVFDKNIMSNKTNLEKYMSSKKGYDEIQGYKNIINKLKIETRRYRGDR